MDSNRNHLFEHECRRLNMEHISLDGPRPETLRLDPFANCNCDVLVPGNLPVRVWNLVEQYPPDRNETCSKNCSDQRTNNGRLRKLSHFFRYFQEVADCKNTAAFPHRPHLIDTLYRSQKRANLLRGENVIADRESILLNLISKYCLVEHIAILQASTSSSGSCLESEFMHALEPHPHPHLHLPLPIKIRRIHIQRLPKGRVGESSNRIDFEPRQKVQRRQPSQPSQRRRRASRLD